jgi:hypothetical protein
LNRRQPTLSWPESAGLSVKWAPVDSRLIQLERCTCHTLWHRLGLDFVSDDSTVGRLSAYTGCPLLCRLPTHTSQPRAALTNRTAGNVSLRLAIECRAFSTEFRYVAPLASCFAETAVEV